MFSAGAVCICAFINIQLCNGWFGAGANIRWGEELTLKE